MSFGTFFIYFCLAVVILVVGRGLFWVIVMLLLKLKDGADGILNRRVRIKRDRIEESIEEDEDAKNNPG